MKLFIIGNGFDKGHGLATSYWDFRTYLENRYPDFLNAFEEHYYIYPGMDGNAKRELLWNDLETNLANINEDVIIEQAFNVEMGLESGDIGIEDTLYVYFTEEFKYIQLLAKYLKQWVRTIRIRDVKKRTTLIKEAENALYITFNYTGVLQLVYKIGKEKIIHIHGSLRELDDEPVLGHGNKNSITEINEEIQKATRNSDEKTKSICRVVENYYLDTFKDINKYTYKLDKLKKENIAEIIIIGHSIAGVDIPYFNIIDVFTGKKAKWNVYYYCTNEYQRIFNNLISCGIDKSRIKMFQSETFYDL